MLFQHAFRSNRSLFKYGSAILYLNALAEHCTAQLSSFTHADLRQQDAALHAAVLPNPHTAACNRVSAEIGVVRNFGVRADVTWRSDNGALPYARAFFDEDALPSDFAVVSNAHFPSSMSACVAAYCSISPISLQYPEASVVKIRIPSLSRRREQIV